MTSSRARTTTGVTVRFEFFDALDLPMRVFQSQVQGLVDLLAVSLYLDVLDHPIYQHDQRPDYRSNMSFSLSEPSPEHFYFQLGDEGDFAYGTWPELLEYLCEQASDARLLRASYNSPLDLLVSLGAASTLLTLASSRLIFLFNRVQLARVAKAQADEAKARSRAARADADVVRAGADLDVTIYRILREEIEKTRNGEEALAALESSGPNLRRVADTLASLRSIKQSSDEV